MISMRPDGSASVVFVDGDLACAPIRLGKPGVEALMSVGRGDAGRAGREEVAIAEGMALALIVAGIVWAIRLYDRIWRRW